MTAKARKLIKGEKIVEGIGVGKVFFIDKEFSLIPHLMLRGGKMVREREKKRFLQSVKASEKEIISIMENRNLPKDAITILEAHRMMLVDPVLADTISGLIQKEGINAEWAVLRVFEDLTGRLSSGGDYYTRAKIADLEVIKDKLLLSLLGESGRSSYIKTLPEEDFILCAHSLTIADLSSVAKNPYIRGIALESPGGVSHLTVVLRSIGLPAVLSANGLLDEAAGSSEIIVDGVRGEVILSPGPTERSIYIQRKEIFDEYFERFLDGVETPAVSQDGHEMSIGGNIEEADEVELVKRYGGEFIGLFRTELMFLEREDRPTEDDHYDIYYEVLHRVLPMEATIRVFDFGHDKQGMIASTGAMGMRGIRFCLSHPDIFIPQLRALIRASTLGNLSILLPFVSSVAEIIEFKRILMEQAADLKMEKQAKSIKIGSMIELPAALFIAEMLAKEVDFFSIGTNDLIQYLLAVERQDKALSHYFSHFHPSVLRALYNLSHIARKYKIGLSVCGEMGGDPYFALLFMGMGIHSLSMSPISIPIIKKIIKTGYYEEGRELLNKVLMVNTEEELRSILEAEMESRYPNIFRKIWIDNIRQNGGPHDPEIT